MPMPLVMRILQYIGFLATEVTNILLFVLIFTRASKKIGPYKWLMASFTVFSMAYGVIEILTQPVMHIYGSGIILFLNSFLKEDKEIGRHVAALYCSSYGVCLFLLATHFLYRYLAVCKPHLLYYLNGKRLIILFLPTVIIGITWYLAVDFISKPTDLNMELAREDLKKYYEEDSFTVANINSLYFYYDPAGNRVIQWLQCFEILTFSTLMTLSSSLISYFAIKIYQTVNSHHYQMSKRTQEMQKQLFHTLLLQSIIPFFTLFLPVGLFFLFPFFEVNIGVLANVPSAYISFYPAVDAAIAVFMIENFRNAVLLRKKKTYPLSTTTSKA